MSANAESICSLPLLKLLVDDFFKYIHPLVPFPHEPSFRDAFNSREDVRNPLFLALLASMMTALLASFPRRAQYHLKQHGLQARRSDVLQLGESCHKIALDSRGPGYLDGDINVYDAATSYFLGLAAAYKGQKERMRLYLAECLTILRSLGVHKPEVILQQESQGSDVIQREMGRRLFWIMFVAVR